MKDMPTRIQRRRTKGWRTPDNCVNVSRPSKWGNPFRIGENVGIDDDRFPYMMRTLPNYTFANPQPRMGPFVKMRILTPQAVVDAYGWWLIEQPQLMLSLDEIRGRDLACYCPLDLPCHADFLLELANDEIG